jgi:hypothetical protein
MIVQPNPSAGYFNVSIKNPTSGELNLRIYNSSGMLVKSHSCSNGTVNHVVNSKIDLSSQPNGFYLLKVIGNGFLKYQNLLVSK